MRYLGDFTQYNNNSGCGDGRDWDHTHLSYRSHPTPLYTKSYYIILSCVFFFYEFYRIIRLDR